jgi:DNA-binding HxlR family transcriptional regulator
VAALEHGPLRYAEIRQRVGPVSTKVLTETLRRLDHIGLVAHVLLDGTSPAVGYALTPVGSSLLAPMTELRTWYDTHAHELTLDEPVTQDPDTGEPDD